MLTEFEVPLKEGNSVSCAHCGDPLPERARTPFCCSGCEAVSALLVENGLKEFYVLRERFNGGHRPRRSSRTSGELTESLLDDPQFVRSASRDREGNTLAFALEGIQCAACLWLLERLPQISPAVREVRVDLGRAEIWVTRAPEGSFADIAHLLKKLGYPPHVVRTDAGREARYTEENRSFLLRLGVAASAAGNVMIYAVSVYAGASGSVASYFAWFSFVLSLPVVIYSAWPLWKSVFSSLRMRVMTLDTPVMLAIAVSFIWSTVRLLSGNPHVFFDSISALVFLLLASRYILRRMQQKSALLDDVSPFLLPVWCVRLSADREERVLTSALKGGDRVRVASGARFPADGTLEHQAWVASAFLTGESVPSLVLAEEKVFAGAENFGEPAVFRVQETGKETRLQKILARVEAQASLDHRPGTYQTQVGQIWTLAVVSLAVFLGIGVGATTGWIEGASRALALLVVTCPCGFAFAAPLGQAFAIARARALGIFPKNGEAISRGAEIQRIFLDKTGTLTEGELECLEFSSTESELSTLRKVVFQIERSSPHPVARALLRWSGIPQPVVEVSKTEPLPGGGLRMRESGTTWEIVPSPSLSQSGVIQVELRRDGVGIAQWSFRDRLREDSLELVRKILLTRRSLAILSGDRPSVVREIASSVGLKASDAALGGISPEQKEQILRSAERAMFVGDGANDALALRAAHLGFAVQGSVEASLEAASVYAARPGLRAVSDFLEICSRYQRVVKRALAVSIFYNGFGAIAAGLGWVSPLFAAVLMPVSALTVFAIIAWGLRR